MKLKGDPLKYTNFQRDPRELKDDSGIAAGSLEDPLELKGDSLKYTNFQQNPRELKEDSEIAAGSLEDPLKHKKDHLTYDNSSGIRGNPKTTQG